MADDIAQDAPVVEAEAPAEDVTSDDVELEDIEVTDEELDDFEDDEPDTEEESEESPDSVESQDSEEESEEVSESTDEVDEEAERKQRNAEYAQKRIAEKQAKEQQLKDSQLEYLQAAEDDKDLALRQLQIDAYNNKVDFNTNKLQNGIDKAAASIDLLTGDASPEVKEFLLDSLDEFEALYVTRDQYGNPTDVKGDVYTFLQNKADSVKRLTNVGARTQTKAKDDAKTRTMTPPSKAPKEPKKDSDLEDFDSAWG
jgi:hypothetical protein